MSGAYEGRRAGLIVHWVCRCVNQPPLVGVALPKGHWVSPIIRDSHHFGLSLVLPAEKLVVRKFSEPVGERESDPFDCMATERLTSASPLLSKSPLLLDCEVVRHLDLEAETEMFRLGARMLPVWNSSTWLWRRKVGVLTNGYVYCAKKQRQRSSAA